MTSTNGGGSVTSSEEAFHADLLVVGAGMAGMSAAALAAARGAVVAVVEKAEQIGGSAALSGGFLWTLDSYDILREEIPLGDAELGRVLIERYDEAVEWVRSLGVEMSKKVSPRPIPRGSGYLIDILGYLDQCQRLVRQAGGVVITSATVESLLTDDGRVVGAIVRDRDGQTRVQAPWTLLATGGFQGDEQLRRTYIGEHAGDLLLRSNPHSTGDGLQLGLSVGADTAAMGGFYGHLIAYPLTKPFVPADYLRLAQSIYSPFSVLVDRHGRRFVDESLGYYSNAQALARVTNKRALVIADERTRLDYAVQAPTDGMETIDLPLEAEREGAHVARADDLATLCRLVSTWGYNAAAVEATLRDFNHLVSDAADELEPPRKRNRRPLDEPPYFAVEVQPAITFAHGGLRIDTSARVLNTDGQPIAGLLAAGVDGAGVHNVGYAGGLSVGVVFAMQAVDTVFASGTVPAPLS